MVRTFVPKCLLGIDIYHDVICGWPLKYTKNDKINFQIDKNIVISKFLSYFSPNQMTILDVDLTMSKRENQQKNRQYFCQIVKSLFKLTGYQVKMKIFLSISEIIKMKVKLVNYFLVCV
jgi:hypothetical protein